MTGAERESLIDKIAQQWTNDIEMDALLADYKERQEAYLKQLSEQELIDAEKETFGI